MRIESFGKNIHTTPQPSAGSSRIYIVKEKGHHNLILKEVSAHHPLTDKKVEKLKAKGLNHEVVILQEIEGKVYIRMHKEMAGKKFRQIIITEKVEGKKTERSLQNDECEFYTLTDQEYDTLQKTVVKKLRRKENDEQQDSDRRITPLKNRIITLGLVGKLSKIQERFLLKRLFAKNFANIGLEAIRQEARTRKRRREEKDELAQERRDANLRDDIKKEAIDQENGIAPRLPKDS